MSKRKQEQENVYGQLYTADEYRDRLKYGYGQTYSANEYKKLLQRRQAEATREKNMQRARQRRANRIGTRYMMDRNQPAPWNRGGKLEQMQNDTLLGGQKTTAQKPEEKKPADFRDWSMVSNLLNPKSGVNKAIAKRPQSEQDYWQNVRDRIEGEQTQKRTSVSGAKTGLEQDMANLLKIKYMGMSDPVKDPAGYVRDIHTLQTTGNYEGNDLTRYSTQQLEGMITDNQQKKEEAQRRNARDQEQLNAELWDYGQEKGKYGVLAERGVPFGYNREGQMVPVAAETYDRNDSSIEYLQGRPEDYEGNEYEYDELLYDWLHGKGAYAQRVNELQTDEDVDELDSELNELWEQIENGEIRNTAAGMTDTEAQMKRDIQGDYSDYDSAISGAQEELERRNRERELAEGAPQGNWEYDPNRVQTYKVDDSILNKMFMPMQIGQEFQQGDETDKIYQMIGNPWNPVGSEAWYGKGQNDSELAKLGNVNPAYFMNDEQKNTFLGYYLNGDKASAKAFYDAIYPALATISQDYKAYLEQQMAQDEYAPLMIAERMLMPEVAGAFSTIGGVSALLGDEEAKKPYSDYYTMSHAMSNIQQGRANAWGDWFAKHFGENARGFGERMNGMGYSIIDNARRQLITKGISAPLGAQMASTTAKTIDFMLLGSDVMGSTMAEELGKGRKPEEAFVRAAGSAAIEIITENMWWDKLFSADVKDMLGNKGEFAKYMYNIFQSEGWEEVSGQVMDTLYDECISALYNHRSELSEKYQALIDEGMDPTEAGWKVGTDWMKETGWAYISGGLSALLSGGARATAARVQTSRETLSMGKTALGSGIDLKGDSAETQASKEKANLMKILEASEGFEPGTETRLLAKDIRGALEKDGKIDKAKVGKLVRTIMEESNEKISSVMENVLGDALQDRMIVGGMTREQASAYSDIMKQALITDDPGVVARMYLQMTRNPIAMRVWDEYAKSEDNKWMQEQISGMRKAARSVMEMMTTEEVEAMTPTLTKALMKIDEKDWISSTALEDIRGEKTGSPAEVVVNGEYDEVVGFGKRNEKGEDGKNHTVATAKLKSGKTVDISAVRATNQAAAQLLKFMENETGKSAGSNLGTALLNMSKTANDMVKTVTDAVNILWSEYLGEGTAKTTLTTEEEKTIRDAVKQDMAEDEKNLRALKKTIRPGQGKVTLNGQAYGTDGFSKELDKLRRNIRAEAEVVASMMKSIGMDVTMYYSPEESKQHGVFNGGENGEGIRINLAGMFNAQGVHKSAVATVAHEATHWLAANAPTAYRSMQKFVLQNLGKTGFDVRSELRSIMDNYELHGESLDMGSAIDELTAMGFEQVLTSEELINDLKAKDPTLVGKVKQAVEWVLGKLRSVLGDAKLTSSRYARALSGVVDDMAKIWKVAYEEATGVTKGGEGAGAQHSFQETDERTATIMTDSNGKELSKGQQDYFRNSKAVDDKGRLVRLYHGTTNAGFFKFAKTDDIGYFFTDDERTANTYSDTYEEFAPRRAESWDDVNNLIRNDGYEYRQGDDGRYRLYDIENNEDMSIWAGTYAADDYETAMERDVWGQIARENDQKLNYTVYANLENPLIIEGNGSLWNGVVDSADGDMYEWDELTEEQQEEIADNMGMTLEEAEAVGWTDDGSLEVPAYDVKNMEIREVKTTREWVADAKDRGYDGVIFREIQDEGMYGGGMPLHSDVYVVFDANQVKSVNNLNPTEDEDLRYALADGREENAIYIKDGVDKEGNAVSFIDMILDGKKLGETRTHKRLTRKWVGIAKDGYVYGRVRLGDPIRITKDSPEYKAAKIAGTNYDIEDGGYKYYYPILEKQDFRNDPKPLIRNGNYGRYNNEIRGADGKVLAEVLPGNTITKYSYQSWSDTDIQELTKQLIATGLRKKDVQKWIQDVNSIAAKIAEKRDILDYTASPYFTMLKNNAEYIKTLDASTLCAKRLLYQGIFNEIQSMLPNTPLMPEDLIKLINKMKKKGLVTPCGFCYVESRRKMLGKYAKQWLDGYDGKYKPLLAEVTTTDGLENLQEPNLEKMTLREGFSSKEEQAKAMKQAYQDFVDAMNAKGSANPKVVQLRTDYRGEILKLTDNQIKNVKEIGGLRVQSFSDFEVIHMIDMMQAVLDMAAKELTSQAYTKVPEFAWVFGDTGIKINLSLVGKNAGYTISGGHTFDEIAKMPFADAKKLITMEYDDKEGMPQAEAMALRKRYSKNVGTILVGINEQHIIAAMGDDSIDFIIPFHKSGWNKKELTQINGLSNYKDFTRWQNEKRIGTATESGVRTIPNKKSKIRNFGPVGPNKTWDGQNGYWDFRKSGTQNAIEYLRLCKEDGRVPKFANFLEYDGKGGYRLPEGDDYRSTAIRNGYWKLLIDFKMYDNDGKGSPQAEVKPVFNMEKAREILGNYDGNSRSLPSDHELANEFVQEYKAEHPNRKVYSYQDETDYDVRQWMETVPEWSLQTAAEKELLRKFGNLQMKAKLDRERMRKIDEEIAKVEKVLSGEDRQSTKAKESIENALESAGVFIRNGRWLSRNNVIIGKVNDDGTIYLNKQAEEGIYTQLKAAGFNFTGRKGTYYNGETTVPQYDEGTGKTRTILMMGESEAKRQAEALKIRKQNLQTVMDQTEDKLQQVLGDEGFARMMYQQQKVLEGLRQYETQGELKNAVGRMEETVQRLQARIEENRKAVEELEKGGIVGKFRELLGTTTAEQTAAELKKEYSSTWTAKQIRNYLDPIILKMKTGEDFQADVETLAGILISSDSRNRYETLESLRGLTITLGKGAQQELKAQNSSLKEVRARLAGTGITVKYGERSTLEADIEDLRAEYPMIPELGDEKDALGNFLNWIDSMKSVSAGMEFYDQRLAEAMAVITRKAAGTAKGIYMPNDPKAQQQVLKMMEFVKGLNAETAAAERTLTEVAAELEEMKKTGAAASGKADLLMKNVNVAIDYYNRISRIAVDEAKQKKESAVIEQLKSKHAEKIVKNNEEWRALIQRDADARKQAEQNNKYKAQINTNLKRMWNLLKNPKGLNNIPEHMQGLARMMLDIFVDNDMNHGNRFLNATRDGLTEMRRVLDAWEKQNGKFRMEDLLAAQADEYVMQIVQQDLLNVQDALEDLRREYKGKNKLDALQHRAEILKRLQENVSEIYGAIKAEQEILYGDKRVAVEDAAYEVAQATEGKQFREWNGKLGGIVRTMHKAIISGNMTPEYFFRTLGNKGLNALWENYHWAENKNGIELQKAKDRLAEIAEKHGYKSWDMKQKVTLELGSGNVEMTLGQVMSLWATWKREKNLGPEMSEHLTKGGFYAEKDLRDGILGRTVMEKKAHRVTEEDMQKVHDLLTKEQRYFIDDVVLYMSRDMSELGNAASMSAYGIKLYKESYYFPFQMWDGVKSRKSNDAGAAAGSQDRAFHPSFSKSRMHGANNAVVIGDFMQTATDHIVGMINYATMGLANESLQKVLNQQTAEGAYGTKRNMRAILEEAYGKEAMQYLSELQRQLNGGAVHTSKTLGDKLISAFRKNAVAGSMSVALQQPLSYIRAAMLINPKYLTQAVMKEYFKGSHEELMKHSGVAVIKEMGRFDMNAGQSAREYLMPDGMEGKVQKIWNAVGEYSTILPSKMDAWTWTRMWVAVKAEQHDAHPEMDMKSDKFLDLCAERFNEVMRRTQVYDSVLVKSANMRNDHYWVKQLTSFMAEPSLTLNVLADSVRSVIRKEAGSKVLAAKAAATFLLSAVMQAAIKGLMGSGRNPDEKKTWLENFLYRFQMSMLTEANPISLIPGYSDMVTLLKEGKIEDDAMGAVGKLISAFRNTKNILEGGSDKGLYRDFEDSLAQILQIFTNVPAKNLMRDGRAMWNWFIDKPYADRATDWNVIAYQTEQARASADTLVSVLLKDAGFKTTNAAYYQRIYEAKKAGDEEKANSIIDYLLKGKGVKQETIDSNVAGIAKKDDKASAEETAGFLIAEGANAEDYIKDRMKEGKLDAEKARELLQKADPEKDADSIWWTVDRIQYQLETNAEKVSGNYYRLWAAMDENKADGIRSAVKNMLGHGMDAKNIRDQITKQYKTAYLNADSRGKVKIKDAIEKAYKELGFTKEDADKVINKWK